MEQSSLLLVNGGRPRTPQLEEAILQAIVEDLSFLESVGTTCNKKLIKSKPAYITRDVIIEPVSSSFNQQVEDHVTRVFLEKEPLLSTFSPCKTGGRERDLRKTAKHALSNGFSVMALDESKVVGACLNVKLDRKEVFSFNTSMRSLYEDDALFLMELLCTDIHKKLEIFSKANVNSLYEISWLSVDPCYADRGIATKLVSQSLKLGAQLGFKIAKSDCTGPASAAAHKKAGMEEIYKQKYDDYKMDGKIVFKDVPTRGSHIIVVACRLKDSPPYVMPLNLAIDVK